MSFRGDLLINFYMSQEKNIKTRIWPSHVHGSVQMSCILYLCILGYLYIYNHKTLNGSTHICNQDLIMLRYRFGFPGIFFLFNVWWGAKSNWQNGKYKIFCNRNQVHQFQVLELLLDQDTGQTCGKLRWEVSLIRGGIIWRLSFYQTHYLTSQVPLIRHVIRSPSFFLITPVIWLWTLVPCHPWPDNLFISPSFNPDSSCFRKMCCQLANHSSHAWY